MSQHMSDSKLKHIKKDVRPQDFRSEDLLLLFFFGNHYVFETKIEKSESIIKFLLLKKKKKSLHQNNFLPTHTQIKVRKSISYNLKALLI